MTVKRRGYAYAGEHAGWLDRAAKRLLKVEDNPVRAELFLKIVRRALKLLRVVDDSSGSLQSVLWKGSHCFEVWKQICQSSDKSCLKGILKKVLPEDTDGLADGLFSPESALPIPDPVLTRLSTFGLGFNFFRNDNLRLSACGAGFAKLPPRKAV